MLCRFSTTTLVGDLGDVGQDRFSSRDGGGSWPGRNVGRGDKKASYKDIRDDEVVFASAHTARNAM